MRNAFSVAERSAAFDRVSEEDYDLVVVGGGITGAGVFRDAVLRGLRTLLVEREDFASGTSSKSSKLIHGGLRYLEHFHIRLTRESTRERELLLKLNPHLVRPMQFLLPIYRDSRLHPVFIRMGLRFYEFLAGGTETPFRMLRPAQVMELAPKLRTEGLRRAALYYDSTADDARLVLANIIDGVTAGGTALNYTEAVAFHSSEGRVAAVEIRDRERGTTARVRASCFVNAAGIHCDALRGLAAPVPESELRASKGVHLVVPRTKLPIEVTVAFANRADGRLMFCIPWGDVVLVGTTDTYDEGDVRTTDSTDQDYVLEALRSAYTDLDLGPEDIISSFAGVRTLLVDSSKRDAKATSVSREHAVYEEPAGMITVAGGKLTTFRLMALNVVDLVLKHLPEERRAEAADCSTGEVPLGGAVEVEAKEEELQHQHEVSAEVAQHLVRSYGARAHEPLEATGGDAELLTPLIPGSPYLRAELPYLARTESPVHLEDVLARRLRAAIWSPGQALEQAADAAGLVATVTGWDDAEQAAEVERYRDVVRREFRPITS